MQALLKLTNFVSKTFALWAIVLLFSSLFPEQFEIFAPYIPYLLGLVMFGMGITLTFADFSEVAKLTEICIHWCSGSIHYHACYCIWISKKPLICQLICSGWCNSCGFLPRWCVIKRNDLFAR